MAKSSKRRMSVHSKLDMGAPPPNECRGRIVFVCGCGFSVILGVHRQLLFDCARSPGVSCTAAAISYLTVNRLHRFVPWRQGAVHRRMVQRGSSSIACDSPCGQSDCESSRIREFSPISLLAHVCLPVILWKYPNWGTLSEYNVATHRPANMRCILPQRRIPMLSLH